jgi:hypothetical protein
MLTLRHTGFSSPVYRDQLDYTLYEDSRAIGRSRSEIRGRTMRNDNDRRIVLDTPIERRLPMPNSLQYPLELDRRLLRRWDRLRTATAIKGAAIDALSPIPLATATVPVTRALVGTMPPRNPKNDDDIDDEDEDNDEETDEDREPAVIREPDRDE